MVLLFKAGKYSLRLDEKTLTMAIINLTPDSFYSASRFSGGAAEKRALQAVEEGADIIDLGAQSTAPGSTPITAQQELERLLPELQRIREAVDIPISVDTFFPSVAEEALRNGADIVNDVSGSASEEVARIVKEHGAGWIIMHTGGKTSDMNGSFPNGVISDVAEFFNKAHKKATSFGIEDSQLCFDPGIGFGKTRDDDLTLISNFNDICVKGCAMLAGLSRKRVTRLCGDALAGTVSANTRCILCGADIIRVHDIKEGSATAKMADMIKEAMA